MNKHISLLLVTFCLLCWCSSASASAAEEGYAFFNSFIQEITGKSPNNEKETNSSASINTINVIICPSLGMAGISGCHDEEVVKSTLWAQVEPGKQCEKILLPVCQNFSEYSEKYGLNQIIVIGLFNTDGNTIISNQNMADQLVSEMAADEDYWLKCFISVPADVSEISKTKPAMEASFEALNVNKVSFSVEDWTDTPTHRAVLASLLLFDFGVDFDIDENEAVLPFLHSAYIGIDKEKNGQSIYFYFASGHHECILCYILGEKLDAPLSGEGFICYYSETTNTDPQNIVFWSSYLADKCSEVYEVTPDDFSPILKITGSDEYSGPFAVSAIQTSGPSTFAPVTVTSTPTPQPTSISKPYPTTLWVCPVCGKENTGHFCTNDKTPWQTPTPTPTATPPRTPRPTSTPSPTPSPSPTPAPEIWECSACGYSNNWGDRYCGNCAADKPVDFSNLSVGDIITFGNYPQTADGKSQPVEWIVLRRDDPYCLVASLHVLDKIEYGFVATDWYNSKVRGFLNKTMASTMFTDAEMNAIFSIDLGKLSVLNHEHDNQYPKDNDYLFLLSRGTEAKLLSENRNAAATATQYLISNGYTTKSRVYEGTNIVSYWLRVLGKDQFRGPYVREDGEIGDKDVDEICGLRPAMWLDMSALAQLKGTLYSTPAPASAAIGTAGNTSMPEITLSPSPMPLVGSQFQSMEKFSLADGNATIMVPTSFDLRVAQGQSGTISASDKSLYTGVIGYTISSVIHDSGYTALFESADKSEVNPRMKSIFDNGIKATPQNPEFQILQ